jgi:PHD/YefM family antitoxin component YafN of YafNO toxin-antitoxin module
MTTLSQKFQSSELSRNSASVFAAAEVSPVLVTRRDGEDLVLMTKEKADATTALNEFAAQLLGIAAHSAAELAERLSTAHPWILALRQEDQEQCARDLLQATRTALATGQPQRVISEMLSWRETARAISDGLQASTNDWRESLELVDRPV